MPYTRLDKEELKEILDRYNIKNATSFKLLQGGSENTNYLVSTKSTKYVLSICEQKTIDQAIQLANLLQYLVTHQFNTSKVLPTSSHTVATIWQDKPIIVKEYIDGTIKKMLTPSLLKLIGQEMAHLHTIDAPDYLPHQLNYGKEEFINVKKYAANTPFDNWMSHILDYISPFMDHDLPRSIIHSDLFWDNVIISTDETSVTIMDFEEAAYYYRIFDIGMAIIGTCAVDATIKWENVKHLINGYQSISSLSDVELKCLQPFTIYAGASMTYWRHQNYNYVNPNPAMSGHYQGLKILVDYMMSQNDDCLVNLLD